MSDMFVAKRVCLRLGLLHCPICTAHIKWQYSTNTAYIIYFNHNNYHVTPMKTELILFISYITTWESQKCQKWCSTAHRRCTQQRFHHILVNSFVEVFQLQPLCRGHLFFITRYHVFVSSLLFQLCYDCFHDCLLSKQWPAMHQHSTCMQLRMSHKICDSTVTSIISSPCQTAR